MPGRESRRAPSGRILADQQAQQVRRPGAALGPRAPRHGAGVPRQTSAAPAPAAVAEGDHLEDWECGAGGGLVAGGLTEPERLATCGPIAAFLLPCRHAALRPPERPARNSEEENRDGVPFRAIRSLPDWIEKLRFFSYHFNKCCQHYCKFNGLKHWHRAIGVFGPRLSGHA